MVDIYAGLQPYTATYGFPYFDEFGAVHLSLTTQYAYMGQNNNVFSAPLANVQNECINIWTLSYIVANWFSAIGGQQTNYNTAPVAGSGAGVVTF